MTPPPTNSSITLSARLLDLLWQHWSCLGVPGQQTTASPYAIDPEALVLATCHLGRRDPRLFDEMLGWLRQYGHFLSIQRLRATQRQYGFAGEPVLSGVAAYLQSHAKSAKWRSLVTAPVAGGALVPLFHLPNGYPLPAFGQPEPCFVQASLSRGPVVLRDHAQPLDASQPAAFTLKLRALFGTNVRADAVAYLAIHPTGAHASFLARQIGYDQKSVQEAMVAMAGSGLLHVHRGRGSRRYRLAPELLSGVLAGTREPPRWLAWSRAWRLLEILLDRLADDAFLALPSPLQAATRREQLAPLLDQ